MDARALPYHDSQTLPYRDYLKSHLVFLEETKEADIETYQKYLERQNPNKHFLFPLRQRTTAFNGSATEVLHNRLKEIFPGKNFSIEHWSRLTFKWTNPEDTLFFSDILTAHRINHSVGTDDSVGVLQVHVCKLLALLLQCSLSEAVQFRDHLYNEAYQRTEYSYSHYYTVTLSTQHDLGSVTGNTKMDPVDVVALVNAYYEETKTDTHSRPIERIQVGLITISSELMKNFYSFMNHSVKPLIAKYAEHLPEIKSGEAEPTLETILKKIIFLRTTNEQDEHDSEAYKVESLILMKALQDYQSLLGWQKLASVIVESRRDRSPGFDCLHNIFQLHFQYREIKSPADLGLAFYQLKLACLDWREKQEDDRLQEVINLFVATINEVQYCVDEAELTQRLTQLENLGLSSILVFRHNQFLVRHFVEHISVQQAHFLKNSVETFQDNLRDLKNNIELLKMCPSLPQTIKDIFLELQIFLESNQTFSEKNKKIFAKHFGKMVGELIAGKLKTAEEILQFENQLKFELLGRPKPLLTPKLITATGGLVGLLALAGNRAVAAGVTGLACCYTAFYNHNQYNQYKQQIEPIEPILTKLKEALHDFCANNSSSTHRMKK